MTWNISIISGKQRPNMLNLLSLIDNQVLAYIGRLYEKYKNWTVLEHIVSKWLGPMAAPVKGGLTEKKN